MADLVDTLRKRKAQGKKGVQKFMGVMGALDRAGQKLFPSKKKYKGPRGTYEDLYGPAPVHVKKKKRPPVRQAKPLTTKPTYAADRPPPKANRIRERLNRKK